MSIRLGVVMDPIQSITIHKDSTFAMLLEAQQRHWKIFYIEMNDLFMRDGISYARAQQLVVKEDPDGWYTLSNPQTIELGSLDVILMRKDPPVDMEYIYATHLLELAEPSGTLVINRPQSLRDANEKLFTARFTDCAAPTLVSRNYQDLRNFYHEHQDIILKPLDGMGGTSIFRVTPDDKNLSVILETLTQQQGRFIMAQRFIPEIVDGDKRILIIDGEAVPYALARIPAAGETRGNLAAGGKGVGIELSKRDQEIVARVGPVLRDKGIIFAGLDVIGDWLTEINVTSPTCIRELDAQYGINISAQLMDTIERRLT